MMTNLIGRVHIDKDLQKDGVIVSGDTWYDINNLKDADISIPFIASTLSKMCRYTGHIFRLEDLYGLVFDNKLYTVAQHSVLMAESALIVLGNPFIALECLLHDAPEAIFGDIIRPLKQKLTDVRELEKLLEERIFRHYGIPLELSKETHMIDMNICVYEMTSIIGSKTHESECWTPKQSAERFVLMYDRIQEYIKHHDKYHQEVAEKSLQQ